MSGWAEYSWVCEFSDCAKPQAYKQPVDVKSGAPNFPPRVCGSCLATMSLSIRNLMYEPDELVRVNVTTVMRDPHTPGRDNVVIQAVGKPFVLDHKTATPWCRSRYDWTGCQTQRRRDGIREWMFAMWTTSSLLRRRVCGVFRVHGWRWSWPTCRGCLSRELGRWLRGTD